MLLKLFKVIIFWGSLALSIGLSLLHQTSILGNLALYLLTLIIFIKPAVRLFPTVSLFKFLLAIRRELGEATAFAVFGHVASQVFPGLSLFDLLQFDLTLGPKSFQFWGFWAFILIIPLFLTSNDFSTRLLKRNWFYLHKLIHPLYIFAMIHVGLQEGYLGLIPYAGVVIILYFSRFLASRGVKFFVPPSNDLPNNI